MPLSDAPLESGVIVPVPEAEPFVRRHRLRYDSVALRGVPAHITVLFPFVPQGQVTDATIRSLREALATFTAFSFSLTNLERFPEGAAYLAPEPTTPFVGLTQAVTDRFPGYLPYGGAHAEVIPHLTVAQLPDTPAGELAAISRHLPIECVAREIWFMTEDDERHWHTRSKFSLGDGVRV